MLSVSLQYIKIPLHGLSAAPGEGALLEGGLIHRVELLDNSARPLEGFRPFRRDLDAA